MGFLNQLITGGPHIELLFLQLLGFVDDVPSKFPRFFQGQPVRHMYDTWTLSFPPRDSMMVVHLGLEAPRCGVNDWVGFCESLQETMIVSHLFTIPICSMYGIY